MDRFPAPTLLTGRQPKKHLRDKKLQSGQQRERGRERERERERGAKTGPTGKCAKNCCSAAPQQCANPAPRKNSMRNSFSLEIHKERRLRRALTLSFTYLLSFSLYLILAFSLFSLLLCFARLSLSLSLSLSLCIHLSIYLSNYISIYQSIYLSKYHNVIRANNRSFFKLVIF